jgi:PIN domain nuclease of toxin-antitoxin system
VKILLDTHVAIWAVSTSGRLPRSVKSLIDDSGEIWVSYCSLWEIAVKSAPGRKRLAPFTAREAADLFQEAGFALLEIKMSHLFAVGDLPLLHGDPFDRLIVAQALAEPLRLVTHDRELAAYSDTIISW